MCGIVGYVGDRDSVSVLVKGLQHLEYRGYDSAGIACLDRAKGSLFVVKEPGKLSALKQQLKSFDIHSQIGIGHTRWATHGEPSRNNAHPHKDNSGRLAIIHNGIIENHAELREELKKKGFKFHSDTDTEVAINLIASYYKKANLVEALKKAVKRMNGFFAFVVLSKDHPNQLLVFKRANPLVIGLGEGENFIASDVPALLSYTKKVIYLNDDEYAVITPEKVTLYGLASTNPLKRKPATIAWTTLQAKKSGYSHFMLKEIFEQPKVLQEAIVQHIGKKNKVVFDTVSKAVEKRLKKRKRVYLVSCGTAHHAGIIGAGMIEELAKVPTKCQVSSEFRYADPILSKDDLVILITQSGETADTLAALREAKSKGAMTLAVVNAVGSTIAREADTVIYTHAGPEIGVASTKAYVAQLSTLFFLSLYLATIRKKISKKEILGHIKEFKKLPKACAKILKKSSEIERCAKKHYHRRNFLYIGRGYNFATALEGALKLKEIAYAHALGYAAGEMKHGPIALIDHEQPVISIAPKTKTYEKMISNIEEIRAREGIIISIGNEKDTRLKSLSKTLFEIPETIDILSPILTVIPLQIFAYKIAILNGRDVDQPRNLAKSVTVE